VSLEIVENGMLQITDEDSEYNCDAVGVGTYTVKGTMKGFADTIIQNVEVTVDEVTELDFG